MSAATFATFESLTNQSVGEILGRASAQRRAVAECTETQAQVERHMRSLLPLKASMEATLEKRRAFAAEQGKLATAEARGKVKAVGTLWETAAQRAQLDAMKARLADAVQGVPGWVARRSDAGAVVVAAAAEFDDLVMNADNVARGAAMARRSVLAQLRAADESGTGALAGCAAWQAHEQRLVVLCFLGPITCPVSRALKSQLEALAAVLSPTVSIVFAPKASRGNAPLFKRFGFGGGQRPVPATALLALPWEAPPASSSATPAPASASAASVSSSSAGGSAGGGVYVEGGEARGAAAAPEGHYFNEHGALVREEKFLGAAPGTPVATALPEPDSPTLAEEVAARAAAAAAARRAAAAPALTVRELLTKADALEIVGDASDRSSLNRSSPATAAASAKVHFDAVVRAVARHAPLALALGTTRFSLVCARERSMQQWVSLLRLPLHSVRILLTI